MTNKDLYCAIEQLKNENNLLIHRITNLTQQLETKKVDIAGTNEENVELSKLQASMVRRHVRTVYYRAYKYCFFDFLKHEKYGVDACLTPLGAIDNSTKNKIYKSAEKIFHHETSQNRHKCCIILKEKFSGKYYCQMNAMK